MGGTFDPIHFGHLVSAEEAYFSLGLSEVIFVPTGNPPHKRTKIVSSAEDRYTMTLLATLDNPHFKVSRLEIERGGDSHTVDTLREMRHWYAPGSTELYFITGLDGVLDILSGKEPYAIVELCRVVAASRRPSARKAADRSPYRTVTPSRPTTLLSRPAPRPGASTKRSGRASFPDPNRFA